VRPRQRDAVTHHAVGADLERQAFAEAEERIAGEPLGTLDALEQETRLERRELDVRRYRRVEVGRDVERGLHDGLSNSRTAKTKKPVSDSAETGFARTLRRRAGFGRLPSSGLPRGTTFSGLELRS